MSRKKLSVLPLLIVSIAGMSFLHSKPVAADWYDDLGDKYTVYQNGSNFLYWNGKDNGWKILSDSTPQVHLDSKACTTNDDDINFYSSKTFTNCRGLEVTAKTSTSWFNEANLAFKIGDFDSKETVTVSGGRITQKGSDNSVTIASDKKSAKSASSGCSGGNPNKTQGCSILIVFNYGYGNSFKIDLDNEWNGAGNTGSSGHEFWYDGPSKKDYRTLTFNPSGGSVADNKVQSDGTIGDEATLWSHTSGSNVLREYEKDKTANEYPVPIQSGYTFLGWYTASSGGTQVSSRTMSNNEVLYAQWQENWNLVPTSSADKTSVLKGTTINFTHTIRNSGPTAKSSTNGFWRAFTFIVPSDGTIPANAVDSSVDVGASASVNNNQLINNVYGANTKASGYGWIGSSVTSSSCNPSDQNMNYSNLQTRPSCTINNRSTSALSIGDSVCMAILVTEYTKSSGTTRRYSRPACVSIGYAYDLRPTITIGSGQETVSHGDIATFTAQVAKNDDDYISNQTVWEIRKITIAPSNAAAFDNYYAKYREGTAVSTSVDLSCTWYMSRGAQTCSEVTSGTRTFQDQSTTVGGPYSEAVGMEVGSRICYAIMVNSRNTNANNYREFLNCVLVAKYPSLQVAGGPVRTGGAFSSSATTCSLSEVGNNNDPYGILMHNYSSTSRGSFGLAALSVGRIEYFGSSNIPISANALSRSLLFAAPNAPFNPSGTNLGLFMGTPNQDGNLSTYCLPNLAATYKRAVTTAPRTTNAGAKPSAVPANTSRVIDFTGNNGTFTLSTATLSANQRVVIVVTQGEESENNTVRITGNISYGGGPYTYGTKPPQFVLLVDGDIDIEVAAGVTELNGIYSTKGNIYTCDASGKAATDTLTTATCNQQLTVKGTMIAAKQILPYRTYGFDTTANTNPAEQFRLTPETLLSDYLWSQESLSIRTVLQRELPTRL